jgi:hypothetical protein
MLFFINRSGDYLMTMDLNVRYNSLKGPGHEISIRFLVIWLERFVSTVESPADIHNFSHFAFNLYFI